MSSQFVSKSLTAASFQVSRASGSIIVTDEGTQLIDFVSAISCLNLGHRYPAVVEAIHEQADRFLHQFMIIGQHQSYLEVCQALAEVSPCRGGAAQKSILSTTGAEAVENAVKIARTVTGRTAVISFDRAFHGRTLLGMSLSGFTRYKKGFGPFAPDIYQVEAPYEYRGISDERALQSLTDALTYRVDPANVACVVVEPVQGEGGLIPLSQNFLQKLRDLCDLHGMLLVFDESQTGVGRTGQFWAADTLKIQPDLLVSGGSLGGGLPLSAVTGSEQLLDAVRPGGLGGTFSGTPLATAAAAAMLKAIRSPEVLEHVGLLESRMGELVSELARTHEVVGEVRNLGPFYGIELVEHRETRQPDAEFAAAVIRLGQDRGVLVDYCGAEKNIIRLIPALNMPLETLERGFEALSDSFLAAETMLRE